MIIIFDICIFVLHTGRTGDYTVNVNGESSKSCIFIAKRENRFKGLIRDIGKGEREANIRNMMGDSGIETGPDDTEIIMVERNFGDNKGKFIRGKRRGRS